MTPLAHLASGYWVYKTAVGFSPGDTSLLLALGGAIAPDIDALFSTNLNVHRNTVFHAPLCWLVGLISIHFLSQILNISNLTLHSNIFFACVFIHLFLDWFSGRTAGIRILYPFSKKVYALFPIKPEKGNIPLIPTRKKHLLFWKYYLENKFLVTVELLLIVSPLIF